MKSILKQPAAIAFIVSLAVTAAVRAENHIVTATGNKWFYRDFKSGAGEVNPVRISAAAGDTVEFRQTDGRHGVFFYLTAPGRSELGRRIDVGALFQVIGDGPKLKRLSNRLFRRENLSTPAYRGARTIVKVRLSAGFSQPLYFGCRENSVLMRNSMFGVITPQSPKKTEVKPPKNLQFARQVRKAARADTDFALGDLSNSGDGTAFMVSDEKFFNRQFAEQAVATEAQWFKNMQNLKPSAAKWYYALSVDLDGDGDLDVVAAISPRNKPARWWALFNNAADGKGRTPKEQLGFTEKLLIGTGSADPKAGEKAFAVTFDVNNDRRPDLVVYNGEEKGLLHIYLNRPKRRRFQKEEQVSFQPPSVLQTGRFANLKDTYLAYPFDADFDGWTDLLVAAKGQDAVVFFNFTPGSVSSFTRVKLDNTSAEILKVGLQDVNQDARSDLLLQIGDIPPRIILNHGDRKLTSFK